MNPPAIKSCRGFAWGADATKHTLTTTNNRTSCSNCTLRPRAVPAVQERFVGCRAHTASHPGQPGQGHMGPIRGGWAGFQNAHDGSTLHSCAACAPFSNGQAHKWGVTCKADQPPKQSPCSSWAAKCQQAGRAGGFTKRTTRLSDPTLCHQVGCTAAQSNVCG